MVACALAMGAATTSRAAAAPPARELQQLLREPCASRADCLKAVAVLMAGNRAPTRMHEVIDLLDTAHVVRPSDTCDPGFPATRGYASLLFMRAICERKSLLSRIFPNNERFAYNHMKFLRTIPGGGHHITISGPELLSLLALCQDYWDHPHRWLKRL